MATPKTLNPTNRAGKKADSYETAFLDALKELTDLMEEREALDEQIEASDRRIARLRRGVMSMGALVGLSFNEITARYPELFPDVIDEDTGLTDAIREVLKAQRVFHSAIDVRDRLKGKDYDLSRYKNVLASIHTILKRLHRQQEVEIGNDNGRATYRWVKPVNISADDMPF